MRAPFHAFALRRVHRRDIWRRPVKPEAPTSDRVLGRRPVKREPSPRTCLHRSVQLLPRSVRVELSGTGLAGPAGGRSGFHDHPPRLWTVHPPTLSVAMGHATCPIFSRLSIPVSHVAAGRRPAANNRAGSKEDRPPSGRPLHKPRWSSRGRPPGTAPVSDVTAGRP